MITSICLSNDTSDSGGKWIKIAGIFSPMSLSNLMSYRLFHCRQIDRQIHSKPHLLRPQTPHPRYALKAVVSYFEGAPSIMISLTNLPELSAILKLDSVMSPEFK